MRLRAIGLSVLAFAGCVESAESPSRSRERTAAAASAKPEFVPAPTGEVTEVVAKALAEAAAQHRTLVVYVGATWCEPCQVFHHAVEEGRLDGTLADVRFLEFDADADRARLDAAGYGGRYIPRFVVPREDGGPSGIATEGGVKGDAATQHIVDRLLPMIERSRSSATRPAS
jgi:thiol:disulfide interchange protein